MYISINIRRFCLISIVVVSTMYGCKKSYTPKPIGYHRIGFPDKEYVKYSSDCPFTFEYPEYGAVKPDSSPRAEPCWLNIHFQEYNGTVHLSYKQVNGNLNKLTEDARELTYKHTIKAEAITEQTYENREKNVFGILYDVKGNAASALQFYLTDSSNHFIRGSLYFNTQPNKDSLAPVIDFFYKDIIHFMESLKWKYD